ncbi:MAG: transposase [Blautia sp.]|nr:transposase [Blautia sp.]
MKQQTFSDVEYSNRRGKTRRERFLDSMEELLPWEKWIEMIRPYYYRNTRGRKPKAIEVMLRMYLLQRWYHLSAEGIEEAVSDSYAMRRFLGINFLDEQTPDASTLLRFRHLLENHHMDEQIAEEEAEAIRKAGFVIHEGLITDAVVVRVPKNLKKSPAGKRTET